MWFVGGTWNLERERWETSETREEEREGEGEGTKYTRGVTAAKPDRETLRPRYGTVRYGSGTVVAGRIGVGVGLVLLVL